jgi:hypothetical protein
MSSYANAAVPANTRFLQEPFLPDELRTCVDHVLRP